MLWMSVLLGIVGYRRVPIVPETNASLSGASSQ
jgi:hypothetical protein